MTPQRAFLSIDFEDFAHDLKRDLGLWETGPLRAEALWQSYRDIDAFLDGFGVRATFFTTGIVAAQMPDLVTQMAQDGHEIACHYYFHDELRKETAAQVEANLQKAKDALETASGQPVLGFRAPKFRIDTVAPDQYRAVERHFAYDSSLCVATPQNARAFAQQMGLTRLALLPIYSDAPYPGLPPLKLGGSYLKVFPMHVTRRQMDGCQAKGMVPHIYLHPYEFARQGEFWLDAAERAPLGRRRRLYWGLRQHQWHSIGNQSIGARLSTLFREWPLSGRLCDHLDLLEVRAS